MRLSRSQRMLKYQKAKVKLLEYDVPREDYPKFNLNYRDLAFPTILTLSEYAESVIQNDEKRRNSIKDELHFCSEFYDAAMKSREQVEHDLDFLLTGAIAYFFQDNYGSAMVLLSEINWNTLSDDMRGVLAEIFHLIFYGKRKSNIQSEIISEFEKYIKYGYENQLRLDIEYSDRKAYGGTDERDAFFAESLYAVMKIAMDNSARKLLPGYSNLGADKWAKYFQKDHSIKMVWPAQKLIGEKNILQGKNGIVQLPTGVGKTKSIELIVRSMFLAERGNVALIAAPLRALCNEITDDMRRDFADEAAINQFSDILEIDFENIFQQEKCNRILICTPEKLQFIFHHRPDLISEIDLFVFDEGHLFDDMNRGAMYELLIADIKRKIDETQQIVILSAVLSNADKILEWITGEEGVLAYDEKIESTPKVIGFASKDNEIHYYSDSLEQEDFYIPRAIKRKELKAKKANCQPKYFPENKSQDIALYYMNQLCKNGGVAIYLSQRRSIPAILKRLIDVSERGYDFSRLEESSDHDELEKLHKLLTEYYGTDHAYVKASLLGVLPHYSTLANGIRLSVEYAFRKGKIKAVACTSTLAQGVNIPVKYMIMTSLNVAQKMISTRNFQNLIGRTARAGVYTEGSILLSDNKLYDERDRGRGYYIWQDVVKIFDPQNAEACGSAILSVVQDFPVGYKRDVFGDFVSRFICEHICDDWDEMLIELLDADFKKNKEDSFLNLQTIRERIEAYHSILGKVENEICYLIADQKSDVYDEDEINKAVNELFHSTFAYFLANDIEKERLHKIFRALAGKISKQSIDIDKLAISMVGINLANKIMKLIENNDLNHTFYTAQEFIVLVVEFYNEIYPLDPITDNLCINWINGNSYADIEENCGIKIIDAEKKCGDSLSYKLSFLIGNIIDYLEAESVNLETLSMLQKQVKYGVRSTTSISICEKVFNDRIISNLVTKIIGNHAIEEDEILNVIKNHRDEIMIELQGYPSFFADRIRFLNALDSI